VGRGGTLRQRRARPSQSPSAQRREPLVAAAQVPAPAAADVDDALSRGSYEHPPDGVYGAARRPRWLFWHVQRPATLEFHVHAAKTKRAASVTPVAHLFGRRARAFM
jgi:hypothetical protein